MAGLVKVTEREWAILRDALEVAEAAVGRAEWKCKQLSGKKRKLADKAGLVLATSRKFAVDAGVVFRQVDEAIQRGNEVRRGLHDRVMRVVNRAFVAPERERELVQVPDGVLDFAEVQLMIAGKEKEVYMDGEGLRRAPD
jgi:hypothetical protein